MALFVIGALAVIRYAKVHGTRHRPWLTALLARRPAEKWAKEFDDPQRDALQKPDEVLGALHLRATDKVADIGAGAIVDFKLDAPEGPPPDFRLAPERVASELDAAGYSLVATHTFLPRQYFLVFQRKSSF